MMLISGYNILSLYRVHVVPLLLYILFDAPGQTFVCDTKDSRRDKKVRSLGPITFAPLSLQTIKEKVKH
jgi:hypothetical protein